MSLIGKMLGDLEDRQANLTGEQDPILDGLTPVSDRNFSDNRSKRRIPVAASLFAGAALLTLVIGYVPLSSDDPPKATISSFAIDTPAPSKSPKPNADVGPAANLSKRPDLDEYLSFSLDPRASKLSSERVASMTPVNAGKTAPLRSEPRSPEPAAQQAAPSAASSPGIAQSPSIRAASADVRTTAGADIAKQPPARAPSERSASQTPVRTPGSPNFSRVIVSAETVYRGGLQLYRAGSINDGLEQIMLALEQDPDHIQARTTLATFLADQGRTRMALDVLQQGLALHPRESGWAQLRARLLYDADDVDGAVQTLRNALPDVQEDPEYHGFLAALLQRQNRHSEAVGYYKNILEVKPHNGIWWMGFGISLERIGQSRDANFAYERALDDNALSSELRGYVNKRIMIVSRR